MKKYFNLQNSDGKYRYFHRGIIRLVAYECQSYSYSYLIPFIFILLMVTSCKKLVEIKAPVTSINEGNVFSNDETAISALTGIYANISVNYSTFSGVESISLFSGLSADEFTLYPGFNQNNYKAYYKNTLASNSTQGFGTENWSKFYNLIFTCNAAIDGLNKPSSLTPAIKQQLLGEAKFLRGFFYFYLINLYGDVPLILSTDYVGNSSMSRSSVSKVYEQVVADLKDAQELLSGDYLSGSLQTYTSQTERVRPTKWAAAALLARVYLYTNRWADAELSASMVINNSTLFSLSTLDNAFVKASLGNKEAIWQLQPVSYDKNTEDGFIFVIPKTGPSDLHPVFISPQLLTSFEPNDKRKSAWIDSVVVATSVYYFPYKYKINTLNQPVNEYLMMLRLAEVYLIRAEARAQQENISGAQSDLYMIRQRAGLGNTTANNKVTLLSAILHERQVELFTELGHRWLDLKRTSNVDVIMTVVTPKKGGTWQSYQQLYPLLYSDLQKDPNLSQNTGY